MWVEEHEQVEREREGITIIGKEKSRERKDRRRERAAMLMFCCCGVLCEMDASPQAGSLFPTFGLQDFV